MNDTLYEVNYDGNVVGTIENSGDTTWNYVGKYLQVVDGKLSLVGDDINFGEESGAEPVVLGNTLRQILTELMNVFNSHIHPTGTGPSGPPTTPWTSALPPMLSQKVRTS